MMTPSVSNSWQRIDTWLTTNAPQAWHSLNGGVSEEEILQKEAAIGLALPEDVKASYRIHDGCSIDGRFVFMGWDDFSPLKNLCGGEEGLYQVMLQDPDWANHDVTFLDDLLRPPARIQPVYRHAKWLSLTQSSDGHEEWCLDLAPAPQGHPGQTILWSLDDGPIEVVFFSFAELLATYANQLEAGVYIGQVPPWDHSLILTPEQLQERRTAYLRPTPAKPTLIQAMHLAWERTPEEEIRGAFTQVLQMEEASAEDRFFAYYALVYGGLSSSWRWGLADDLLVQWQGEAQQVPATHWTRQELAYFAPHW